MWIVPLVSKSFSSASPFASPLFPFVFVSVNGSDSTADDLPAIVPLNGCSHRILQYRLRTRMDLLMGAGGTFDVVVCLIFGILIKMSSSSLGKEFCILTRFLQLLKSVVYYLLVLPTLGSLLSLVLLQSGTSI